MDEQEAMKRAHALCTEIAQGMAKMGLHTSCHFDAGLALIAEALQEAFNDGARAVKWGA